MLNQYIDKLLEERHGRGTHSSLNRNKQLLSPQEPHRHHHHCSIDNKEYDFAKWHRNINTGYMTTDRIERWTMEFSTPSTGTGN